MKSLVCSTYEYADSRFQTTNTWVWRCCFNGTSSIRYLIGNVLRRAPLVAKAVSKAIKNENLSTYHIARKGWETLWSKELIRKKSLYQFGLEKLMRFDEKLLREFFGSFFQLPKNQWYGFLTDTLSLKRLYMRCA